MAENDLHLPWSFWGKIKLLVFRYLLIMISFPFKKKFFEFDEYFEEDPINFNRIQALYLANKYYVKKRIVKNWDYNQISPHWLTDYYNFDQKKVVKISVAGDILPYAKLMTFPTDKIWEQSKYYLKSDIKIANLEAPIYLKKNVNWVPEVATWNMNLNINQDFWNHITNNDKYQFTGLTLNNNHMLDMGKDGLLGTIDFLKSKKIEPIGSPGNYYTIIEKNEFKLGLISFTFSLNLSEPIEEIFPLQNFHLPEHNWDFVVSVVNELRQKNVDAIFILPHGNNAYVNHPQKIARENLIRLAEITQVEAILVCHAHQVNPFEWIHHNNNKSTLIAHSLGDFIGYDIWADSRWFQIWNFKFVFETDKWVWKSAYSTKHHRT